jgi:hypothetical protein
MGIAIEESARAGAIVGIQVCHPGFAAISIHPMMLTRSVSIM